jgi:hypothetical protein
LTFNPNFGILSLLNKKESKMNSFNRTNLTVLRSELNAAIATVAAKHGLIISLGNCRFTNNEAHFTKLSMIPKTLPSSASIVAVPNCGTNNGDPYNTVESREYLNLAYLFNLPKNGLGRQFRMGTTQYTIIGLKSSRRKYPVIAIGPFGGRYKFSADTVRNGMVV